MRRRVCRQARLASLTALGGCMAGCRYYYRGCQSWGWFYPFHFAPMTSDMVDLTRYEVKFHMGRPFFPFQQLLGCLPAASSNFLPRPYAALMNDKTSPLKAYYPNVMVRHSECSEGGEGARGR